MTITSLPPDAKEAADARIRTALRDHAEAQGHGFRRLPFAIEKRDGGVWQGGISGAMGKDWMHVELLAVAEGLRGTGLGGQLIAAAEALARRHGMTGLWLDSYSFQAPGFYRSRGFVEFGRMDDQPLGAARHFFHKRLTSDQRRLIPGDRALEAALGLVRSSFAAMEGVVDPPSSVYRMTLDSLARDARTGEVWISGDPPVATMTLSLRPDCLYLGKLAVAPGARGQGLARRMVDLALARARIHGRPHLELQTRVELTANQAIFRKLGFAEIGRSAHPGFDRPTSITYRCPAGMP
jgi:GNAT superfamily N-acetyltransferase